MIQLLSKEVADKIAAGEVVDRPLSIVKELVENALDAGATSLVVEIRNGGKSYIRVTDNGTGIPGEETETAFLRHATSKIQQAEDLNHIRTLGFRGEALSSIAAVTRIELLTKRKEDKTGTLIKLSGGQITSKRPAGCPDGTTIVIEDLFFNTPARLKFLKSDATETTLIVDFVSKIALAYAHCQIRLISNGNTLFNTMAKGNRLQNILSIYDKNVQEHLLPVSASQRDYQIEGYLSKPSFTKTNRKSQIHFVNGRVISSKLLESAIEDAYKDKLFDGRHPLTFLFLEVNPEKIDVNIHPNKREIRFENEAMVKEFVISSIRKTLKSLDAVASISASSASSSSQPPEKAYFLKREEQGGQVDIKNILLTMREGVPKG